MVESPKSEKHQAQEKYRKYRKIFNLHIDFSEKA
jgi:hypothetical protein